MNSSRLKQLLEFLKDEPHDPFNIYAVATEYRGSNPLMAKSYYDQLLSQHPDYLPTYYHAAHLYIDLNNNDEAEKIFIKGIDLAKSQGNALALRELQNAYNNFLFDE